MLKVVISSQWELFSMWTLLWEEEEEEDEEEEDEEEDDEEDEDEEEEVKDEEEEEVPLDGPGVVFLTIVFELEEEGVTICTFSFAGF
jgi:ABC-type Zn2+ transport system substrate-binding protein/surface adhesin